MKRKCQQFASLLIYKKHVVLFQKLWTIPLVKLQTTKSPNIQCKNKLFLFGTNIIQKH